MRIAVFLDRYRPEDGGAYTMQGDLFHALCSAAASTHHKFVVISLPSREIEYAANNAGMEWHVYTGPGFVEKIVAFIVRSFPSLRRRWLRQTSLDRVLMAARVEFAWFIGPRAFEINLPYLTIVLDLQHRKQPWFPELRVNGEWETRERLLVPFLRKAAGIIVGTEVGKAEVTSFLRIPAERVHILPHPMPVYALNSKGSTATLPQGLNPGYLFYPAQFWAHKNHVNLLLALQLLKNEGLQIPLALAGSDFGNQRHIQRLIAEMKLDDQVTILGFVPSEQLIALYQNALALTYVSYFGPENLPPLEAFALGCPVIAAKADGAEEQLGDAALLVDPSKPEEIAAAIRKVYANERLRTQLIERGRKRALKWTAKDFVDGVFAILDQFEPVRRNWA